MDIKKNSCHLNCHFSIKQCIAFICVALMVFFVSSAQATSNEVTEQSQLSNDIEQLKNEVIKLNRELFILEEDLLFPASTQVAIFVSVDIGQFFTLDSVELKINEQDVAGFLYTERQRISLEQGGIQRLYQGNLKIGSHQLTAIFIGQDQEKRTVKRAITHRFDKEDDAIMIELKLEDNQQKYQAEVHIEEWLL